MPRRPTELTSAGNYGVDALLAIRARFFLTFRLVVRLSQIAVPDGGARTGWWRFALLGFAAVDFGQYWALRDPARFGLKTRLLLDSLDAAFWSLAPYPRSGAIVAVWTATPLGLEAGLRRRFRGYVVPAAVLVTTLGLHLILGRPTDFAYFAWPVFAVSLGILLNRYVGQLQRRTDEECEQRRSAEQRRATLAGENQVAMGASSVVDAIEAVIPALGPPEAGSALWTFADAWKLELAAATAGCAAYLGQVLAEWAADFNAHPDLSSRVAVCMHEGVGTTVLTETQATKLRALLDELGLQGTVSVELVTPTIDAPVPGGPVCLLVSKSLVEIPADPDSPPRPYDTAPTAFLIGAGIVLADFFGLPLRPIAPLAGWFLTIGAAWWTDRQLRLRGVAARQSIVFVACAVAVIYTTVACLSMVRFTTPGGTESFPIVGGLDMLALIGGMYWRTLTGAARSALTLAGGAVIGASWLANPDAHRPVDLLLTAAWSLPLLVSGLRLEREIEKGAAVYAGERLAADTATYEQAFLNGQQLVIDLVARAVIEARQRVATVRSSLSAHDANALDHRLEEVNRRLSTISPADGSPSSTTTS